MNRRATTSIVFAGLLGFASFTGNANIIFSDGFESATMGTTNSDGFRWSSNNRTSVVTMEDGVATAVYNNGPIHNQPADTRDWTAKEGDHSLRFRYASGEPYTEQRFDMHKGHPELWVSYWIRIPVNFSRGTTGSPTNNKWFKMWMGNWSLYDQSGVSHFTTQDWPGSPATNIDVVLAYDNAAGTGGRSDKYSNFITPADAGKWMHVVYHMKASSGGGATDGRASWYRKWDGDSGYETIADLNNIEMTIGQKSIDVGYNGWGFGYMMGYANRPYAENTEWLVDDFTLSQESPVGLNAGISHNAIGTASVTVREAYNTCDVFGRRIKTRSIANVHTIVFNKGQVSFRK